MTYKLIEVHGYTIYSDNYVFWESSKVLRKRKVRFTNKYLPYNISFDTAWEVISEILRGEK